MLTVLIANVEGCSEYMASVIAQVYTLVFHDVGGATCAAVGCLFEWDDCINKHGAVVLAVNVTKALIVGPTTQRQACTTLDALLKILQNVVYYYPTPPKECRTGLLDNALLKAAGTGASRLAAHATRDSLSGELKETEWMSLLWLWPAQSQKF